MKVILKYISALLIIYLSFSYCGNQSSGKRISDKNKILAVIKEKKLSLHDLKKNIEILPEEYKVRIRTADEKKNLLQDLVATEMLFLAGKEKALDRDEKILLKLENLKKWFVRDLYINKFIKPKAIPTIEEIGRYYDQHKKDKFLFKGYVDVKDIQVSTLKKAQEVYTLLEKKKYKFEDLANAKSNNKNSQKKESPLLRIYKDEKIPKIGKDQEFINSVFSLKPGEISKPIKSKAGYHIIKLVYKRDDTYADFGSVKEDIKKTLEKEKFIQLTDIEIAALKKKYNVKIYPELVE